MFTNPGTYHYAVLARNLVNAGGVGLALIGRTTLLVHMVENLKVITISVVSGENIGEQFQNRGLSNTCLSNNKDGVWRFRFVLRCLDDPLPKRLYVAKKDSQNRCIDRRCPRHCPLLDSLLVAVFPGVFKCTSTSGTLARRDSIT